MAKEFKTIEKMEEAYYTQPLKIMAEQANIPVEELVTIAKAEMERDESLSIDVLSKTNYPVLTTTTGARNVIYGAQLWSQVCLEANAFGVLPKIPYDKGGYRAATAVQDTTIPGVAEAGAIPDSRKPTMAEIDVGIATLATTADMSEWELLLQGKDDVPTWGEVVNFARDEFVNLSNRALLTDNGTLASAGSAWESIDRVCGSYSELSSCTDGGGSAYSTNDLDIYGIDRDGGAGWTDAYVSHNSGADRTFSLSLLDNVIDNCVPYWKNGRKNKVILTGYDTARRIAQLENPKGIFSPDMAVQFTVNGVQTVKGIEAGIPVASYDGIPIICSNNVGKDTISRIYVLDLDNLFFAVARPVTYVETNDYLLLGAYKRRGNFSMVGQLVCTNFHAQGKVRDLK